MSQTVVSLNTKIDASEKERFVATTASLGMTPSSAIKVFISMFNQWGGFPFDVRHPQYPVTVEERESLAELDRQIADGTVRRFSSFDELLVDVDEEIAAEDGGRAIHA